MSGEPKPTPISRTAAGKLIGVSRRTITHWVEAGQLPVESTDRRQRPLLARGPVDELAAEVAELRRRARETPGLLAEAVSRLEQEDPRWQAEFEELYGDALGAIARGDPMVSAAPGPDWDEGDEWDPDALDFRPDD